MIKKLNECKVGDVVNIPHGNIQGAIIFYQDNTDDTHLLGSAYKSVFVMPRSYMELQISTGQRPPYMLLAYRTLLANPNMLSASWTTGGTSVEVVVASKTNATSSASPPIACARCGDYSEYAVANQPDGSFKCYRCRSSTGG